MTQDVPYCRKCGVNKEITGYCKCNDGSRENHLAILVEQAGVEVMRLRALIAEVEWQGDGGSDSAEGYVGSVCPWCKADPPWVKDGGVHHGGCEAFPPCSTSARREEP